MEVVASLSQGRTAAAQCGLFTYKSVPVIFEPPCIMFVLAVDLRVRPVVHSHSKFDILRTVHRDVQGCG